MKHKLRFLAMFLAVAILLPVGTAFAADAPKPSAEAEEKNEKPGSGDYSSSEEVIYALLNQGGDSEDIYSVVILNSETGGTADYFGPFLDVKNLTDTSEAVLKSGKVSVIIPKGRYYFQSRLAVSDLPWNIKIEYKLNGNIADPATLGGASGKLEINIKTSKNEAVDPKYYEAYIMQVSLALPSEKCSNILAEEATIANAGGDKSVVFASMPGKDLDATLTCDVSNFSMKGITIAAVPFNMAGQLDMLSGFTGGLNQLTGAVSALSKGAASLSDGALQLKDGASQFGNGLAQLSAGSAPLRNGSAQIMAALNKIDETFKKIGKIAEGLDITSLGFLPPALYALADGFDNLSAQIGNLPARVNASVDSLQAAFNGIGAIDEAEIAALTAANPESAALQTLIANYRATAAAKAVMAESLDDFRLAAGTLSQVKTYVDEKRTSIRTMAQTVQGLIDGSSGGGGINAMLSGFSTLAAEYSKFHDGLVAYTNGVDSLNANWASLYGGVEGLSGGVSQLSGGVSQLNAGTSRIPGQISAALGSFTGEFTPSSFLSAKNESCSSVQFVLTTKDIEEPKAPEPPAKEAEPTGFFEQFWIRLKALFT